MVFWVIGRREADVPALRAATAPRPPGAVERLGPFESIDQARSAQAARSREAPRPALRFEIVRDYA